MRNNQTRITILYNLKNNKIMSLPNLMKVSTGKDTFQHNTGDGIFFGIINELYEANFVTFSDKDTNDFLKKYNRYNRGAHSYLLGGYALANYLETEKTKDSLNDISIKITDYFIEIQDVIGFSVTDLYKKENSREMRWTHPIFNKPNPRTTCDVFVITPFSEKMTPIYDDHIKKVCVKMELDSKRADLILNTESIVNDIWSLINNAQIIICDCTEKNPNVFYELGIAHTLGKKTICITQNSDDIPFDIKHLRYIQYEYTPRGMQKFEEELEKYMAIAISDDD